MCKCTRDPFLRTFARKLFNIDFLLRILPLKNDELVMSVTDFVLEITCREEHPKSGAQSSFSRTLYLFEAFGSMSGLKVNYNKTESLWISSIKNSNSILFSNEQITWAKGKVYALGVWFSTLEENTFYINFSEKIERIKNILNSWSARRLTLLGKITIIKSLAVSQIVHVLSSLPTHQGARKEINTLLYDILWNSKGDKIKRTEMINDYDKGRTQDDRYPKF